jgi:hypothetical protein
MKRLMISALAFVALLAAGTGLFRSHALLINSQVGITGIATSTSQDYGARGTDIAIQDFEDRSLEFPREKK